MTLRASPHVVSIWRRVPAGENDDGEQVYTRTEVADEVDVDLQEITGDVTSHAFGRLGTGDWLLFAVTGTDVRKGDLIRIDESDIASMVGRGFEVTRVMDWGSRGGVQGVVIESEEAISDGAS